MGRLRGALLLAVAVGLAAAAQPLPARVHGSTEDLRFLATVEAKLEAEMQSLDAPRSGKGAATIAFMVGDDGRVAVSQIVSTSGDRVLDAFAVHALAAAAPFPAPPPLLRGKRLIWTTTRDSVGSRLTFEPQR